MKRILSAAVAALLAAGVAVVAPTTASAAVPSSVVTSTEFYKVTQGNSIDYVRKVFGNIGKVTYRYDTAGTKYDHLVVDFPTYYDDGWVTVSFDRRSDNTWYLETKSAYWDVDAVRTTNKATPAEFNKIATGSTIDFVRKTFGTNGTITSYYDAPGVKYDAVQVEWPTDSKYGWVWVYFVKSSSGTWKVDTRSAYWSIDAARTVDKATPAEFNKLAPGNTIEYARSTFGTGGTITAYFDAPGVAHDNVTIEWPTDSVNGSVTVDFIKNSSGSWRIESLNAYWG